MNESKAVLSRRLDDLGLGPEARAFREEVRVRLRAEGRTRKEATEGAWLACSEKFPPVDPPAVEPINGAVAPIDLETAGDVTTAVLATAEREVVAWTARHGIRLDEAARGELAGSVVAGAWVDGFLGRLPRLAG